MEHLTSVSYRALLLFTVTTSRASASLSATTQGNYSTAFRYPFAVSSQSRRPRQRPVMFTRVVQDSGMAGNAAKKGKKRCNRFLSLVVRLQLSVQLAVGQARTQGLIASLAALPKSQDYSQPPVTSIGTDYCRASGRVD
jgi:hypothetical protein